jgi:hypothetical protein
VPQLKNLLGFIKSIRGSACFTDLFGIIPFPGTQIFQQYGLQYGLEGWWLKEVPHGGRRFLHQYLRRYFPQNERPFFVSPQITPLIKKSVCEQAEQRFIFRSFGIRLKDNRYSLSNKGRLGKYFYFVVVKMARGAFMELSSALSYFAPALDTRFLLPYYKLLAKLWRGCKQFCLGMLIRRRRQYGTLLRT